MIVVSDTGPINYLVQIGRVDLLRELFGSVVIPQEVFAELSASGAPVVVRRWSAAPPDWLSVWATPAIAGPKGEWAAIEIARHTGGSLLCDDEPARRAARREGIEVRGTLGVLQQAHLRGVFDLSQALSELLGATNFYVTEGLVAKLLVQTALLERELGLRGEEGR